MQSKTIEENEIGRYLTYNNWRRNTPIKFGSRIKESTRYTLILKTDATSSVAAIVLFYSDDSYSNVTIPKGFATTAFVTPTNKTLKSIKVQQRSATVKFYIDGSGIFEGVLTAADFEPYTSTTQTITFPQTIYGGYIDLVKSEVVEEFEYIDMKNLNWFQDWNGFIVNRTTAETFEANASPNITCEIYKTVDTVPLNNMARIDDKSITGRANFKYIGIRDDSISSIEDFMSEVSGHHITYKLATPIHYSIDPQTITTLRGANTVWSNSNSDVEVIYYTHGDNSYQHVPTSDAIASSDDFLLVTDDGYAIGTEDDFITY